jgi:hypothetical protein
MCHQKLQYREYVKIYNVNEGIDSVPRSDVPTDYQGPMARWDVALPPVGRCTTCRENKNKKDHSPAIEAGWAVAIINPAVVPK